ncbi:MAG TPA: IPT/TIG domain-containing protein, partial [Bacillota bacterium]|nr:IPT/TIG domain-containing protein [Bacillota bacterium]
MGMGVSRALRALAIAVALTVGALGLQAAAAASGTAPVITSLSVDHGPTAGGNQVVIGGNDFGTSPTVTFGGAPAPLFSASQTSITVTAPPGQGSVLVVVTGSGQASNGATYTYDPPLVTTVSPFGGPTAGANTVVIDGVNFGTSPTVTFGGVPAAVVTRTQTSITVTAPPGVGSVAVVVTVAGQASNPAPYIYDAPQLT